MMTLSDFEKNVLLSFHLGQDISELFGDDDSDLGDRHHHLLFCRLKSLISLTGEDHLELLRPAESKELFTVAILLTKFFVQWNYTGPTYTLDGPTQVQLAHYDEILTPQMVLDGESINENVRYPSTLELAKRLFNLVDCQVYPSVWWWKIRSYFLHERILEEKSFILWKQIQDYDKAGHLLDIFEAFHENVLATLYNIELSHIYLFHYDISKAREFVNLAAVSAGIQVSLAGALGKRTRYQQNELAQLIVQVKSTESNSVPAENVVPLLLVDQVPKDIPLNDDTRLNTVHLSEGGDYQQNLGPLQQIVLLSYFSVRKRFHSNDDVSLSESRAFLDALLSSPKVWSIQVVSLLNRSTLEKDHTRTVGRSMEQLELLKTSFVSSPTRPYHRMHLVFSSMMPFWYEIDAALADIYISLGSTNSALDIYLNLKRWESAIECYNSLQLRHKAEEVIRKELEKNADSVKLWCLLGDATDHTEYYEKAWVLSKEKSARVQRQWGYFYYYRKQYEEAVPHLEKAVTLNPLEYPVWMRLAFSAMQIFNWELCAKAYRHACVLDSDNFESWNNLANAYIKLEDKQRAVKVLIEATKCDFNVWQVWDNLLVVATDCRLFDDVIRSYNRLMDLKGKHVDTEVLSILTRFICGNMEDSNGARCLKYHKAALKLLGRLTASVTTNGELWKLYSDLLITGTDVTLDTFHRSVDCAQKSVRCLMQDNTWDKLVDKMKTVITYTLNLSHCTLEFIQKYPESSSVSTFKTTALFTVNKVLATVQKKKRESIQETDIYDEAIGDLENSASLLNSIPVS